MPIKIEAAQRLQAAKPFDLNYAKLLLKEIFPGSKPKVVPDTYAWVSVPGGLADVVKTVKANGWKEKNAGGTNTVRFSHPKHVAITLDLNHDDNKEGNILVTAH